MGRGATPLILNRLRRMTRRDEAASCKWPASAALTLDRKRTLCRAWPLVALALLTVGCARESTTSSIHPDGTWTRRSVYSIAADDDSRQSAGQFSLGKPLALRDVFTPPSGSGWMIEEKKTGEKPVQLAVTATKEIGATETVIGDLTVKAAETKGRPRAMVVNTALVRSVGPDRWRYSETFHWSGPVPTIGGEMEPYIRKSIRKDLPRAVNTDSIARLLGRSLEHDLWAVLFSPPEPLMLDFYANLLPIPGFSNPDERAELMTRRLGPVIESALKRTLGRRMSPEKSHQTAIKIARRITEDTAAQAGNADKLGGTVGTSPGMDSATESFGGMYPVAITVSVRAPGRVIESNGIVDPLTGDVYWTLYPQAALVHDVVLRATFEHAGSTVSPNPHLKLP